MGCAGRRRGSGVSYLREGAARGDVADGVEEGDGDDGEEEALGHLGQRLQAEQPQCAHPHHAARQLQRGHEPRVRKQVER